MIHAHRWLIPISGTYRQWREKQFAFISVLVRIVGDIHSLCAASDGAYRNTASEDVFAVRALCVARVGNVQAGGGLVFSRRFAHFADDIKRALLAIHGDIQDSLGGGPDDSSRGDEVIVYRK
jgi:hypothetical protein